MLAMRGVVGIVLLALWLYCIFDVITTDESLMRNLPKFAWLAIVILLPSVGSIVWLVAGRPERASFRIGDSSYRARPLGPEDRRDFAPRQELTPIHEERERLAELRMREEQLRRREEELRKREEDAAKGPDDKRPPDEPPLT